MFLSGTYEKSIDWMIVQSFEGKGYWTLFPITGAFGVNAYGVVSIILKYMDPACPISIFQFRAVRILFVIEACGAIFYLACKIRHYILSCAAESGNLNLTKTMLFLGADVNIPDIIMDLTPLDYAVQGAIRTELEYRESSVENGSFDKHIEVIKVLFAQGANPYRVSNLRFGKSGNDLPDSAINDVLEFELTALYPLFQKYVRDDYVDSCKEFPKLSERAIAWKNSSFR